MSRALAEIDFFAMENARSSYANDRMHAADRGIYGSALSRTDSMVHRPVISSIAAVDQPTHPPASRIPYLRPPSIPAIDPSYRPFAKAETVTGSVTSPLTICYNGTVAVFELSHDKANAVMRLAKESAVIRSVNSSGEELLATVNQGLLPLARKKSLKRFLEKRKDDDKKFIQEGPRGKKWWVAGCC